MWGIKRKNKKLCNKKTIQILKYAIQKDLILIMVHHRENSIIINEAEDNYLDAFFHEFFPCMKEYAKAINKLNSDKNSLYQNLV